jgi:tRNA(Ile)-lysidine synthase
VLAVKPTSVLAGIFDGLTGFSRVAVAVSGGSDSMALLRMVSEWRMQQNGPRDVVALTVDHGLRAESADEATQVGRWCNILKIPHQILQWSGEKPKSGIQAKARTARYDLMSDWCRGARVPVLLTAHTADDQAETVFMRQQRTDSDRSLAAIWPENEWRGIKLLRPLLAVRREQLREYLRSFAQDWLDDPSNENMMFERIRARSGMDQNSVADLQAMAAAAQLRVREADRVLQEWLRQHLAVDDYAVVRLPRRLFQAEKDSHRIDIMAWALTAAGDSERPERANVEAVVTWLLEGRESRRSVNGAIVSGRRHVIEVMREPARIRSRFAPVPEGGWVMFDGRFEVVAPVGASVGPMGQPPLLRRPKDVPALAFSALPVVKFADGSLFSAVKSGRRDISATLCERFTV